MAVPLRCALSVPNFAEFGEPTFMVELGRAAEEAGWDGFFVWDHLRFSADIALPVYDPWVLLAAVAQATARIRLGTMVTPPARRRPAKLARETVTLDHLSGGRLVLGVGLGEPADADFAQLGDEADPIIRAEMLDEALEVLSGMWSAEPFEHHGTHYTVEGPPFLPPPQQQPRIPVWVAGVWPHRRPLRRASRWDGAFPLVAGGSLGFRGPTPAELAEIGAYVERHRTTSAPFDMVASGSSLDGVPDLAGYAEAGATWWIEHIGGPGIDVARWGELIRRGPPTG
jgi:alkanesulfonate monooxygenase SsuD/methylene tetrahydromethanopterin reductase-like flavin-dependent oxidoreductase (luciferase family)